MLKTPEIVNLLYRKKVETGLDVHEFYFVMGKFQNRGGKLSVDFVNKIVNHVFVFRGIILYTKVPGENYTGSVFKKTEQNYASNRQRFQVTFY